MPFTVKERMAVFVPCARQSSPNRRAAAMTLSGSAPLRHTTMIHWRRAAPLPTFRG